MNSNPHSQMVVERSAEVKRLGAVTALAGLSCSSLVCAPAIATQLGSQFGYDATQIGYFFSVEFAGFLVSGLLGQRLMPRIGWRKIAMGSLLIFLAGTLASIAVLDSFAALLTVRLLTSSAGALIGVVCMASANESKTPSRAYGFYIMGQLVAGVLGLAVLPTLFESFGIAVFFIIVAALLVVAAPMTAWLSEGKAVRSAAPVAVTQPSAPWKQLRFPALLLFYVALGGIWTFSGELAKQAGLDPVATGKLLSVATFAGVIGAAVAAALGGTKNVQRAVVIGYVLLVVSSAALMDRQHLAVFVLAALVFKFAWTFVLPFVFALIGKLDDDGRIMAEVYLVAGLGLMIGPALAGFLVKLELGYAGMLIVETALVAISGWSAVMLGRRITAGAHTGASAPLAASMVPSGGNGK